MKSSSIALALTLFACSAAPAPQNGVASSVSAPNASFGAYHSFAFGLAEQPKPGYAVTERSLEVQRRLRVAVLDALVARGFKEQEKGDLIVKLAAGTGQSTSPAAQRIASQPQGYIGIDVYDAASGSMVWQGSAFAMIEIDKIDDALLKRGVSHMLADFPPGEGQFVASSQ
ncbi:MAG TPA: DUF4136 domain-containing protein [Polyangiaceae bacterium]|nr:DUF4136 domain-containing protein [Polyangiaceae bacterium]